MQKWANRKLKKSKLECKLEPESRFCSLLDYSLVTFSGPSTPPRKNFKKLKICVKRTIVSILRPSAGAPGSSKAPVLEVIERGRYVFGYHEAINLLSPICLQLHLPRIISAKMKLKYWQFLKNIYVPFFREKIWFFNFFFRIYQSKSYCFHLRWLAFAGMYTPQYISQPTNPHKRRVDVYVQDLLSRKTLLSGITYYWD